MGKKSRLRKMRKESHSSENQTTQRDSTQFVEQLEQLGYRLKQIQRSPDLPQQNIEPKI
ncbi:hypothetical protein Sta7437_0562 [Stanieria cyanosphaera PCC 7437]|uniref:Uncharacterized protein n=1 Tax=Stanieria cyanosphaera (strain ATCC 29371 / PCC 7437) TaxID=111780 RepID=K9XNR4_STAC7|nr:hypothetical protein Sta7437_0562 [Stanieria cyanosphaera PCC 7437]